ncbi:MAG: hypothetical protein AAB953_02425, partial [Patescibacteria group bacterium]
ATVENMERINKYTIIFFMGIKYLINRDVYRSHRIWIHEDKKVYWEKKKCFQFLKSYHLRK